MAACFARIHGEAVTSQYHANNSFFGVAWAFPRGGIVTGTGYTKEAVFVLRRSYEHS